MKIYVVKEDCLDEDYGYENRILDYFSTKRKARKYLKTLFEKYLKDRPEFAGEELEILKIYYESDYRHYIEEIEVK